LEEKPQRFGVYLTGDLLDKLEELKMILGVKSRSRVIQEALRMYIAEHSWRVKGRVCGIIGVVYNHEVESVDEKLTDIQHGYLDVIVSALHVHLTRDKCLLAIVVRGAGDRVRSLVNSIESLKGVLLTRAVVLEAE